MIKRFRTFSFVDRIISDIQGEIIKGEYSIPDNINSFPSSLVAESIGQCAAFSAISKLNFKFRPVAGIAESVIIYKNVSPGSLLSLEADLIKVDETSVNYNGVAKVNNEIILELKNCIGPMLPMIDFDSPDIIKERYEILKSKGAELNIFPGFDDIPFVITEIIPKQNIKGYFKIPNSADFFYDHFPKKAVFPGSLLIHTKLSFVTSLISSVEDESNSDIRNWKISKITNIKLRSFMNPGQLLYINAKIDDISSENISIIIESRNEKKLNSKIMLHLIKI